MAKIYGSIDELIGKTPILRLNNIEKRLGLSARLFAKLEYFIVSHAKTFTLFVEYSESSKLANIMDSIKGDNVFILDMEVSRSSSSSNYFVTFSLKMPRKKASHQAVMTHIAKIESVVSVEEL